jgi:membrane peptidoglycan carboxypeptidase
MQKEAADAVVAELQHQGDKPPSDPQASVVTVVPQTGEIQAMYGGADFSKQQFNLATQSQRSAGSAFKAFTLASAFEQGVPIGKVYNASSPVKVPSSKCYDPTGVWSPANAESGLSGFINMTEATADSINVYFAQLIADVGPANVAEMAKRMGVQPYQRDTVVDVPNVCSITLGAVRVNPLSMTSGYSTIANNGTHCYPFAIKRVVSSKGKTVFKAKPSCQQVMDPKIAAQITSLLKGVVAHGTGTAANIGRPQAGKTGTGQLYQDAWFVGYVPRLVTGVWVGYSKFEIPMVNLPVLGGANAFGGTIAAPIWHDYMLKAVQGLPPDDFPPPPGPKSGTVPDVTGMKQADAVGALATANFTAIINQVPCVKPVGIVCTQSPAGGSSAPLGSGVSLGVSNGKSPKVLVPNVVGSMKGAAVTALEASGFTVALVYQRVDNPNMDKIVLAQSPAGGSKQKPGATVTITIGRFGWTPTPTPSPTKLGGGNFAVQWFSFIDWNFGLESTMFNLTRLG